jgi:hypothetical protein
MCNNFYLNLIYGIVYLCVLIVFSLHRESLKLILADEPLLEVVLSQRAWFYCKVPLLRSPHGEKHVHSTLKHESSRLHDRAFV